MSAFTYKLLPGHVRIHEGDGATTWPWPFTSEHQDAAWKARYAPATLTKEDAMALAGIADAYMTMIAHPSRGVAETIFDLRRIYKAESL